jgi:hypothetical protein
LASLKTVLDKRIVAHASQEHTKMRLGEHHVWIANQTPTAAPHLLLLVQIVRLVHHRHKEVRRALPAPLEKQVPVPMVHAKPVKRANSEQLQRVQLPVWLAQLASIKVTPGVLRASHASQAGTKIRTAQLLVNHV